MGFMRINGRDIDNPTTIIKPNCIVNNRRSTSMVSVRNQSVAAYLDGVMVANWKTDYHEMDGPYAGFTLRHDARLGIGSYAAATIFHSIEVLEVTGKGVLPRAGTTVTETPITPHRQPKPIPNKPGKPPSKKLRCAAKMRC